MGKPRREHGFISGAIPAEMEDAIQHLQRETGLNRSEILRALIMRGLYGQGDRKRTIEEVLDELNEALALVQERRANQNKKKPGRLGKKGML